MRLVRTYDGEGRRVLAVRSLGSRVAAHCGVRGDDMQTCDDVRGCLALLSGSPRREWKVELRVFMYVCMPNRYVCMYIHVYMYAYMYTHTCIVSLMTTLGHIALH